MPTHTPDAFKTGLLTVPEAAKSLELKEETIRKYCRDKKLKCKKLGPRNVWMIKKASVDSLKKKWGVA
jgi:excisionase family DNA binding protein